MALDAIQPWRISGRKNKLYIVFCGKLSYFHGFMDTEIVQHNIKPFGTMVPAAKNLEEWQEVEARFLFSIMPVELVAF